MKTLHLPLNKEWYEMIERGEKTEEYRELKPYWIKRLCGARKQDSIFAKKECPLRSCEWCFSLHEAIVVDDFAADDCYQYDAVRFSYGYTSRSMTFEIKQITIGRGRPEWGAPDCDVFIIKLGKRL